MLTTPSRLACWFEADSGTFQDTSLLTPAVNDGDPVGGWGDQSGNSYHARQGVSGSRPVLKLNQINGLPALKFTAGPGQFLSLGNVLGKPRGWTIFAVMATTNPNVTQSPYGSDSSGGVTAASWGNAVISQGGCPTGSSAPDFGDNVNYSQSVSPGGIWTANAFALTALVHRDNEPAVSLWKNGALQSMTLKVGNASQCVGPASNYSIGREGDYNGIYLDGYVAAFALFDTNLLPADRSSVETYFKTKYGL